MEQLNLDAEKNVVYRYSVSGQFAQTNSWRLVPDFMKRASKRYADYLSEPPKESIHTDCKMFCSLHRDFDKKAPGEWTKANAQEIYDMCTPLVIRSTESSKSLLADKQRRVLRDLAFTSLEIVYLLWSTSGLLQSTGETRLWTAANRLCGSHWTLAVPVHSNVKKARFASSVPETTMTYFGIFMIKKGVGSRIAVGPSEVPKRIKRKHTTYLKITLTSPPSGCEDTDAFGMTHARQAGLLLFQHDPKLVCYVYPKEEG